ncbi:hypothetical protein PT286_02110 [Neisseriaceae bacterium ESL0693]|nr:hypothetical protein [Neisseriaceae bacterium ESL0693]
MDKKILTAWSEPENESSRRVYKRYFVILKQTELAGKIILTGLVMACMAIFVAVLFKKDFEQIIFTDRSVLACIYDNNTDRIISVEKLKKGG